VQKTAIFDPEKQKILLEACGESELIPVWLMLNGVHRHDVAYRDGFEFDGEFISYHRCKNSKVRRVFVPERFRAKFVNWMEHGKRRSPDALNRLVHRVGVRAGLGRTISPMTLRHSHALNTLRKYSHRGDALDLTAMLMGCKKEILMRNYLDESQWEALEADKPVEPKPAPPTPTTIDAPMPSLVVRSEAANLKKPMGLVPANMLALMAKKTAR